jgi:AraC-like DNA-binding protein
MVTTSEIAPAPALAPFVRCYSYREFDTKGVDITKPWHATHEITMPFFFDALPVKLVNPQTGAIIQRGKPCGVIGLATQYNGEMTFNGHYAFFQISFKPNGFHKIFGLPPGAFTNLIVHAGAVFNSEIQSFHEQLANANGLRERATLADAFLLRSLNKQKRAGATDAITCLSNAILKKAGLVTIEKLAYDANMSLRTFERHFTEQVGIGPKAFCCITRFHHAYEWKLKDPERDWAAIAQHCGYFDQMHLIKDCKKFTGSTPAGFFNQTPLTNERYTSRVEA